MQESLCLQPYPEKIVPPHIMDYAQCIDDIRDKLRFSLVHSGFPKHLILEYFHNNIVVSLGYCAYSIKPPYASISDFYTANMRKVKDADINPLSLAIDTHILQSPINGIGREVFGRFLDICENNSISSIGLTPNKKTQSDIFYRCMERYFSERIYSIPHHLSGVMVFKLK